MHKHVLGQWLLSDSENDFVLSEKQQSVARTFDRDSRKIRMSGINVSPYVAMNNLNKITNACGLRSSLSMGSIFFHHLPKLIYTQSET